MDLKNLAGNADLAGLAAKAVDTVKNADIDTKKVAEVAHVGEDKVKAAVDAVKNIDEDKVKAVASMLSKK